MTTPLLPGLTANPGGLTDAAGPQGLIGPLAAADTQAPGEGFARALLRQIAAVSPEILRAALAEGPLAQGLPGGEALPVGDQTLPPELLAELQGELPSDPAQWQAWLAGLAAVAGRVAQGTATPHGEVTAVGGAGAEAARGLPLETLRLALQQQGQGAPAAALAAALTEDAAAPPATAPTLSPLAAAVEAATQGPGSARPAQVDVPVGRPGWDQAMGSRVLWLVNQGSERAEISLNPPELGPVKVRIRIEGDQATLSFAAAQAPAREALEAALPRLREMFAETGLNLAQADVSREGPQERRDGGGATASGRGGEEAGPDGEMSAAEGPLRGGEGLVDTYA